MKTGFVTNGEAPFIFAEKIAMKILVAILLLCSSHLASIGQGMSLNDNIYNVALEKYSEQIDSFYTHASNPPIYDTIFLSKPDFIDSILPFSNNRPVVILTSLNWKEAFRRHDNNLFVVEIFPMKITGSELKIRLIPFASKLKRRKLSQILSDWTDIYFKFNCISQTWEYAKTEADGI